MTEKVLLPSMPLQQFPVAAYQQISCILVWEDLCPKLATGDNCCLIARIIYWGIENVLSSCVRQRISSSPCQWVAVGKTEKVSFGGWLYFDSKPLQNTVPVHRGEPERGDQIYQCLVYEAWTPRGLNKVQASSFMAGEVEKALFLPGSKYLGAKKTKL